MLLKAKEMHMAFLTVNAQNHIVCEINMNTVFVYIMMGSVILHLKSFPEVKIKVFFYTHLTLDITFCKPFYCSTFAQQVFDVRGR